MTMMLEDAGSGSGERYAILVNGYADSSSFYNNISFVHDMLLEKGYKEENIIVLHDHGKDPEAFIEDRMDGEPKGDGEAATAPGYVFTPRADKIVNGPAYRDDVFKALDAVAAKAKEGDEFFFYSTDHGGSGRDGSTICLRSKGGGYWGGIDEVSVAEFKPYIDRIKAEKQVLVFDQCFSGGFADALGNGNRVAVSACSSSESSYISHPMDGFPAAFYGAIRGRDWEGKPINADRNGDGKVSIREAFEYAMENDPFANGSRRYQEHPQLNAEKDADAVFLGDA